MLCNMSFQQATNANMPPETKRKRLGIGGQEVICMQSALESIQFDNQIHLPHAHTSHSNRYNNTHQFKNYSLQENVYDYQGRMVVNDPLYRQEWLNLEECVYPSVGLLD